MAEVASAQVSPDLFAATADVAVRTDEKYYWTVEDAREFEDYPIYYLGPLFEGYSVKFMRRVSHDPSQSEGSSPACIDEDTVDAIYSPEFDEPVKVEPQ